jgi:hypothetical protein
LKNPNEGWGGLRQNLAAVVPILCSYFDFSLVSPYIFTGYTFTGIHEPVVFPELDQISGLWLTFLKTISNDDVAYGLCNGTYFQPIQYNRDCFIAVIEMVKQDVWIERAKWGYKV